MKKLSLIYNPFSGGGWFKGQLDYYVSMLQKIGFAVDIFRLDGTADLEEHIKYLTTLPCDAIVACGGDGTVNSIVNYMVTHNAKAPLAILPSGTANDFGKFLNMPRNAEDFTQVLHKGNIVPIDIGKVNDKYFINVCGTGLFANVSQRVNKNIKSSLGKLGYYLKGLEEIPKFRPLPLRITNSKEIIELDAFLFLALNTTGAGGFGKLVPSASITDGMLDFVAFKACTLRELSRVFIKIMSSSGNQDIFDDHNVLYFKDTFAKVELLCENEKYDICDIDGEYGPKLPITIETLPGHIPLYIP